MLAAFALCTLTFIETPIALGGRSTSIRRVPAMPSHPPIIRLAENWSGLIQSTAPRMTIDDEKVESVEAATPAPAQPSTSADPSKMTMMDNLVFLGYIGGFMAFFYAIAFAFKQLK